MEMSLETGIAVTEITLNDIVRHYLLIKPRRRFMENLVLLTKEDAYQSDIIPQIGCSDLFPSGRMPSLLRTEAETGVVAGVVTVLIANTVINAACSSSLKSRKKKKKTPRFHDGIVINNNNSRNKTRLNFVAYCSPRPS